MHASMKSMSARESTQERDAWIGSVDKGLGSSSSNTKNKTQEPSMLVFKRKIIYLFFFLNE